MKTTTLATLAATAALALSASADIATGWLQMAKGTYDFPDAANLAGGKWTTAQRILTSGSSMSGLSFLKGTGVGRVELRNGGLELWAEPESGKGTVVCFR